MLDFTPLRDHTQTFAEFAQGISKDDLYATSNELIETMLDLVANASDAAIAFEPHDPNASDPSAVAGEETIGWSAGHIIAHVTASSEEGAMLALALARGVSPGERSRYETDWREITTLASARQRLEESRRMRIAMLDAWPDAPDLAITQTPIPSYGPMNAIARFILGLGHEAGHIEQLRAALEQTSNS